MLKSDINKLVDLFGGSSNIGKPQMQQLLILKFKTTDYSSQFTFSSCISVRSGWIEIIYSTKRLSISLYQEKYWIGNL